MVLGGGAMSKLFADIQIELHGEQALRKLDSLLDRVSVSAQNAEQGLNPVAGAMQENKEKGQENSEMFGEMFGLYMNLMFVGMALSQVFGGLAGSMLKLTGVSQTFGAAAKSVLLPFFMQLAPVLNQIAFFFMDLPRPIKMTIGLLVSLAAVLGVVLFFGSQIAMLALSLNMALGALLLTLGKLLLVVGLFATALFLISRAIRGVKPVITGVLLAAIGLLLGALSPLLGIIVLVAGAFATVVGVIKKFGAAAGAIVTAIIAVIAIISALVVSFVSLPVAIAAAVAAVLGFVFAMRDEIGAAIDTALSFLGGLVDGAVNFFTSLPGMVQKHLDRFINGVVSTFKGIKGAVVKHLDRFVRGVTRFFNKAKNKATDALQGILNFIKNLPGKITGLVNDIKNAAQNLAGDLIDGLVKGIKNSGEAVKDALKSVLGPLGKGLFEAGSGFVSSLGAAGQIVGVNDFILTDGGRLIQPDKNDTIVGFNGDGAIQPGGGRVEVNINDPVMKNDVDVGRVVDEVEDRVNRSTRGRSGGLGT